ncbi:hypothetical protein F4821DRAFT_222136 [Hypoxylon rubiginosum]|uniref:Uncharacterized protein n=1 Tax=Hypoxylon rubiginosum TaxID=110542 RepID=A0ACC0DK21_9PEZI|nr:hypothetical protein F4821DRAFT_222136 [Hypoxylon rubiginosum]
MFLANNPRYDCVAVGALVMNGEYPYTQALIVRRAGATTLRGKWEVVFGSCKAGRTILAKAAQILFEGGGGQHTRHICLATANKHRPKQKHVEYRTDLQGMAGAPWQGRGGGMISRIQEISSAFSTVPTADDDKLRGAQEPSYRPYSSESSSKPFQEAYSSGAKWTLTAKAVTTYPLNRLIPRVGANENQSARITKSTTTCPNSDGVGLRKQHSASQQCPRRASSS